MGFYVYKALGCLNSPRKEIGSSLSNHNSKGYGRLETQNDSYLFFQLPPLFWGLLSFGFLQDLLMHNLWLNQGIQRSDRLLVGFHQLSSSNDLPSFLIVNVNRISLKVENLLAASVHRYSERGNKVLYGYLCLSVLNLVRQLKISSVDMEICYLGACDPFLVGHFLVYMFVWKIGK